MADADRVFFPVLARREAYSVKANGNFYAYSHYRAEVAEDCKHRCVYCDAHADDAGGAEAMQLDHFRPESFPEFTHLVNDPGNLHYACGRCHLWKSDCWPARGTDETHNGTEGFVNPFSEDRLHYFEVGLDGTIRALRPPAAYMIRLLRLDREYLRKLREYRQLKAAWQSRVRELSEQHNAGAAIPQGELIRTLEALSALLG